MDFLDKNAEFVEVELAKGNTVAANKVRLHGTFEDTEDAVDHFVETHVSHTAVGMQ